MNYLGYCFLVDMSLELIIGSMFSGKSTELIHRVKRYRSIGMKCCIINHSNDTRIDGEFIKTHDGAFLPAVKTSDILLVNTKGYDAVAIDEGQFFLNLRVAVNLMIKSGKLVIVAGLSGDYKCQKFGEILDLIPFADDVTFKRALCKNCCHPGKHASFTKRISNETQKIFVNAKYMAVCRQCFENS